MIASRTLHVVAALSAATGLALRLAPSGSPAAAPPLRVPAASAAQEIRPDTGDASRVIVASNVFSPRRAPPTTRFLPDWAKRDTAAPVARRAKPAEPRIRLYGITRGGGGAVALIDADPRVPGAEVYQVGDAVRGARITAVTDSTVVLDGPAGPVVLRLPAGAGNR